MSACVPPAGLLVQLTGHRPCPPLASAAGARAPPAHRRPRQEEPRARVPGRSGTCNQTLCRRRLSVTRPHVTRYEGPVAVPPEDTRIQHNKYGGAPESGREPAGGLALRAERCCAGGTVGGGPAAGGLLRQSERGEGWPHSQGRPRHSPGGAVQRRPGPVRGYSENGGNMPRSAKSSML